MKKTLIITANIVFLVFTPLLFTFKLILIINLNSDYMKP